MSARPPVSTQRLPTIPQANDADLDVNLDFDGIESKNENKTQSEKEEDEQKRFELGPVQNTETPKVIEDRRDVTNETNRCKCDCFKK